MQYLHFICSISYVNFRFNYCRIKGRKLHVHINLLYIVIDNNLVGVWQREMFSQIMNSWNVTISHTPLFASRVPL